MGGSSALAELQENKGGQAAHGTRNGTNRNYKIASPRRRLRSVI
jgi:hypothetical protein